MAENLRPAAGRSRPSSQRAVRMRCTESTHSRLFSFWVFSGGRNFMNPRSTDPVQNDDGGDPLDVAFAAYLRACDAGESDDREAFLERFPELSVELARLMEAADKIGRFASDTPPPEVCEPHRQPSAAEAHDAETVGWDRGSADAVEGQEAAVTLPMERREPGDPGPVLPYELGDYRLERILGRGGMGVVYLAQQQPLDRQVAVKMIRSGILAGADEVRRFFAEAKAAARLDHPNIVSVFQFGHLEGHHFFSMEFVEGTDLAKKVAKQPLDCRTAARYVRDVARAIDYAHRRGVLHRDLKPANVLIDAADEVHVTDFGLAKQIDADSSITASGTAIGTPSYMAPEQARGHSDRATPETDVYSLGAILFTTLTASPPFAGESVVQTMLQVIHSDPPRVRSLREDAPIDLETIVAKCLEKSPRKRYSTAAALADDLERYLNGLPIEARPRSRVARVIDWLHAVPLISALTGRRVVEVSPAHRRFQAAMLMTALLIPLLAAGVFTVWQSYRQDMPARVRIAGGVEGGVYGAVAESIARRLRQAAEVPVETIPSGGSLDNRQLLIDGTVDLAPLQASAINDERLSVAAPLFYEAVHVLARHDSTIQSVMDLQGHTVAVGPETSGSRLAAEMVFDSFDLHSGRVRRAVIAWPRLPDNRQVDAAVICIGPGSKLVTDLLGHGWRLVAIDDAISVALQHPTLRPMTIPADRFPNAGLPADGLRTVGTTAFLAVRADAPGELVTTTLRVLYSQPPLMPDMITRRHAAEWQGLALHPAARRFYAISGLEAAR